MSGIPLFPDYARQSVLVKFRAGKMYMEGNMVHPDPRKGEIIIYQSQDLFIHFCWRDRRTGIIEDDVIIFPYECIFKRVQECSAGRVYILKFRYKKLNMFFWMQDKNRARDEEYCWYVNHVINNPPMPRFTTIGSLKKFMDAMYENILKRENPDNLHSTHSCPVHGNETDECNRALNVHPALSIPGAEDPRQSSHETPVLQIIFLIDDGDDDGYESDEGMSITENQSDEPEIFEDALDEFIESVSSSDESTMEYEEGDIQGPEVNVTALNSLLTAENLEPIMMDVDTVEMLEQHLPQIGTELDPNLTAVQNLQDTLTSRHFEEAVQIFSDVFQTGQIGSALQQLGVSESAAVAANESDVESFLKALQGEENNEGSESDEDEDMQT